MGLLTGSIDTLEGDAHKAALEGRTVYACSITQPAKLVGTRTNDAWAAGIAAIEAYGWRLEHFAAEQLGGGTLAHCVFRRV